MCLYIYTLYILKMIYKHYKCSLRTSSLTCQNILVTFPFQTHNLPSTDFHQWQDLSPSKKGGNYIWFVSRLVSVLWLIPPDLSHVHLLYSILTAISWECKGGDGFQT